MAMESYDGPGFPFSPLQCSQGRTRMGGWLRTDVYAASSDCVVILALGDLVTCRHFVRASRGQLSFLLSICPVNRDYGVPN
jgi:hypothetical protein